MSDLKVGLVFILIICVELSFQEIYTDEISTNEISTDETLTRGASINYVDKIFYPSSLPSQVNCISLCK